MSHVFISYSKKNKEYAYALADYLQEKGFNIWIDRSDIDYGVGWWDAIVEGLKVCGAFVVIMTPEALASTWVQREVHIVLDKKPVFPILLNAHNWDLFVLTQYYDASYGSMPNDDFLQRLSQYVVPLQYAGKNESDLILGKQVSQLDKPSFDIDQAIADFMKAYRARTWTTASEILGRIRAAGEDSHPFDPDEFERKLEIELAEERRQQEASKFEVERARQYNRIEIMLNSGEYDIVEKALHKFWAIFPSYDPNQILAQIKSMQAETAKGPLSRIGFLAPGRISFILPAPFSWCEIPTGKFLFGKDKQTLKLPTFYITKYPITYAQFQVFIDAKDGFYNSQWWEGLGADSDHKKQPGNQAWKIANRPRENVSWYDAIAFCRWLSWRIARMNPISPFLDNPINPAAWLVRLPTEQEWEKAARGTNGWIYPWGDTFDRRNCNTREFGAMQTTPVNDYPYNISPFDVSGMTGNVWEWCLIDYNNEYEDIKNNNPCVLRGGSWYDTSNFAYTYCRHVDYPYLRDNSFGFRLVCSKLE